MENLTDLQKDINSAMYSAFQFTNATKPEQNTPFNGDLAAQLLRENAKTTPSLVSTSGGVPSVYGDSQMNLTFDRYYMHPNFDKLGYSPWRDNDAVYNANSSWLANAGRSMKAMGHIMGESFGSNKPFISTLDLFDPLDYDEETAGNISRMMKIGYDTSGGLDAFTNNFLLNSGITLGITASAIIEEAVIAGASALMAKTGIGIPAAVGTLGAGTAATIGKFAKNIGKIFNANDLVFKLASKTDDLKQVYDFSKIGRALDNKAVDFFNPLSNTAKLLKEYPETFKGLNALGKTATSFGAFYADARSAARVLNEAQLEGGLVLNQMVEDGIRKEYDATGQYPSEEKIKSIRDAAQNAAFATTMINLPLIFFSNKVGLDNIIRNLPKGTSLLKALDEVTRYGVPTKIKGQGYKYLTSPLQTVSAGLRPTQIGKTFLNYTRYNFSEAIQENLQEATSAGVINYYTKLFENPMMDQHMLLKESVALGIGEQFTAQGLETFFSGFLTGGLMGGIGKVANLGMTLGQRIYDPVAFKEYQDEKATLKKEFENSANYLDKNFLDLGRGSMDVVNPNAVNAAQQSAASKTMNAADQTGNVKLARDAQRLSMFEHISNAIKGGFYNNIIDDYKSQLDVDDKTLAEAFGKDITEVPKLRSTIASAITQAESIKKLHDKYNFVNPINLKGVSKDDPQYRTLVAKKNAIETVRKMLIMSEDAVLDGVSRMNKISQSLMSISPEFGDVDSDDILSLLDLHRYDNSKRQQIASELELAKATEASPTAAPEDRERARIKKQHLTQKGVALEQLVNNLKSFRDKKKSNTTFTDDERATLVNDFKFYIDILNQNPERRSTVVKPESIDESLNYILDYLSLESENELLTSVISVMQDPQGFANTVNDTTAYLESVLNNANFLANMVNRGVSLLEHNAIYNYMFTKHGVFVTEYEDGTVGFNRPSADIVDAITPVDQLSAEYQEMLDDFYSKKEALSKIDEDIESIKKKKKASIDQLERDRKDFETIKSKLRTERPDLSNEALDILARNILVTPEFRELFIKSTEIGGLAQDIEDAAFTPTTREEVEEALKLLDSARFTIVEDPDTNISYYVQVDEQGNPLEGSLNWKRVTSLYKTKDFGSTKKSAHRGTIIDGLLRALIENKSLNKEQFKEAYNKLQKENTEAFVFDDANLDNLRSALDSFIASIEAEGYTLKANISTLWGTIDGQKVAGTIDILAVNDKGETLLIDLKTSSSSRRNAYAMETALKKVAGDKYDLVKQKIIANNNKIKNLVSDAQVGSIIQEFLNIEEKGIKKYIDVESVLFYKDSDENQLNAYADLLEQRTGIKVKGLFILPLTIQDDTKTKTYTKIEAATEKINNKNRYALAVARRKPAAPKEETKPPAAGAQPSSGTTDTKDDIERRKNQSLSETEWSTGPVRGAYLKQESDGRWSSMYFKPSTTGVDGEVIYGNTKEEVIAELEKRYNAELAALNTTDTKADIERRKQETLSKPIEEITDPNDPFFEVGTWNLYGGEFQGKTKQEVIDKINAKYDAELAALDKTSSEETGTQTNTSNIGPVSSIKLDTVYPIYKDNKEVGSVTLTVLNNKPVFVFRDSKGMASTVSKITSLSNNFFNANEGLFEHWYNNILDDSGRQSVSLYKNATTDEVKDIFVMTYGISKSTFSKNKDLLSDIISTSEDIDDSFKGKLIYGTPGVGKTQLVNEYNARPESERKHTLIDVDDLLLARLYQINQETGFANLQSNPPALSTVKIQGLENLSTDELKDVAKQLRQKAVDARAAEKEGKSIIGGSAMIEKDYQAIKSYIESKTLEFTNENLFNILNRFGETIGTNQLNQLLYEPVLEQINAEKAKGSILVTGTKRFIKEADIAILSEDRTQMLRDKIVTGDADIQNYLETENQFRGKVILIKQGDTFKDALVKGIATMDAENALRELKSNLFNRIIFTEDTLIKLIKELSLFQSDNLTSAEAIELYQNIITDGSYFDIELKSLEGNIDSKAKELFSYFESYYNSPTTNITDKQVFLRKVLSVFNSIDDAVLYLIDEKNPTKNDIAVVSATSQNVEYNLSFSLGTIPILKTENIDSFVQAMSKNRILSFKKDITSDAVETEVSPSAGSDIDSITKPDDDIFNC